MSRSLRHAAVVLWTVASLVVSPVFAQAQQSQAQSQGQTQSQPQDQQSAPAPAPITAKRLNLGPDYSKGKAFFPNIFAPYTPIKVGAPELTNTPRLNQLIQDGKLMLSLDDAIALALPDKILCRDDCAGLCPVCGKDLNAEPHEHVEESADPRWAALESLRESE